MAILVTGFLLGSSTVLGVSHDLLQPQQRCQVLLGAVVGLTDVLGFIREAVPSILRLLPTFAGAHITSQSHQSTVFIDSSYKCAISLRDAGHLTNV